VQVLTPLRSLSSSDLLSIQERQVRLQQYAERYEKAMHKLLPSVVEQEINHIVQVHHYLDLSFIVLTSRS
jgi:hypothetical protein